MKEIIFALRPSEQIPALERLHCKLATLAESQRIFEYHDQGLGQLLPAVLSGLCEFLSCLVQADKSKSSRRRLGSYMRTAQQVKAHFDMSGPDVNQLRSSVHLLSGAFTRLTNKLDISGLNNVRGVNMCEPKYHKVCAPFFLLLALAKANETNIGAD